MVRADRCMKMLDVPQEKQIYNKNQDFDIIKSKPNWPEKGEIEFREVFLRYRPDTEIVLKGLTFKVNAGEKIGIVGRTGAGKSTISLAITRIVEIFQGQIIIDGIDIQDIPLDDLRSRITVIP